MLLFLNSGGPIYASANSCITSQFQAKRTLYNDSAAVKEYEVPALKEDKGPYVRIISPHGGEVWKEGKTYEIRWESREIDKVHISVAVGGKEKGLLYVGGNSMIDARLGNMAWEIPMDFVTGFGIRKSEHVRIMIFDAENSGVFYKSNEFTIEGSGNGAGGSSAEHEALTSQGHDEYIEAIIQYYRAISNKKYHGAYEMLGQCKIILYNADGSGVSFQPRDDYSQWLKAQQNIDSLTVVGVKAFQPGVDPQKYVADNGNAEATLGIRTYMVTLDIKLNKEDWTIKSGRNTFYITVAKGTDNKIRILGIGTGP